MANVLKNLDWSILINALISIVPALICITFHELSHGFVAYKLGDRTAKDMGRLSLNPLKHIDLFGLLMMIIFKFGWAKPVPVNMRNFKNPKQGMAVTALAGPVSNFILAAVFFLIYGLTYSFLRYNTVGYVILTMLYSGGYLSIALGLFNFIPIPPLDGSKIAFSLLSDSMYMKLMRYERFGMILLLIVVWTGILGTPLNNAVNYLADKYMCIAQWANKLIVGLVY